MQPPHGAAGSGGSEPATPAGPPPERLTRRSDFLAAAEGRRFHTERLTAQGRLRETPHPRSSEGAGSSTGLRVGFTVTKRVGHAPERNRIRRRLREAVRAVAGTWPQAAADIVLIARRPALSAPFEALLDDLRKAVPAVLRPRGLDEGQGRPRRSKSGAGRSPGAPVPGGPAGEAPARAGGIAPPSTPSRRAASPPPAPSSDSNARGGA